MDATAFHPEDRSRAEIDGKLAACGWIVQSRPDMNLSAGPGVAVREFATSEGPADYGLFVDQTFCGVVEAGQYNISQTSLMRMPVPVPPQSEMRASLQPFQTLESTREDVASDARDASDGSPFVRQSILKAAFEGRLVPQNPRDEPAERLLARLGEHRDATPPRRRPAARRIARAAG